MELLFVKASKEKTAENPIYVETSDDSNRRRDRRTRAPRSS
jgi:hypothetical protein